jgi:hypothetical protein
VALTGVASLISFLWYALNKGNQGLYPCISALLAVAVASPILLRKDFQFVGIPGVFEIFLALGSLAAAILWGLKPGEKWYWVAALMPAIPSIRISLVSLRAYQRPKSLKIAVGLCLAALFGINIWIGYQHSEWLGSTSVALVKEWFPETTAPRDPSQKEAPKDGAPKAPPPPTPVKVDPAAPVATVAGRALTKDMVDYQRYIDALIDPSMDRNDAVAALLQAYATRAVLEKLGKFDESMLKDEKQWLMNRTKDSRLVHQIRQHRSEALFLDVYVGANGLYKRKLQDEFALRARKELDLRAEEVLKEVQQADGVERPGPKIEGVKKEECRYSFGKSEFIGKFDTEEAEQVKASPKDALAKKLAGLKRWPKSSGAT